MIKTKINRHDIEYFLYAMVKAFYKDAVVEAPDTAEHNRLEDDVREDQDLVTCNLTSQGMTVSFNKGKCFLEDKEYSYEFSEKEDDSEYKDIVRGYIYDALADYSGNVLPWGNLTGIRPTKLYMNLFRALDSGSGTENEYTKDQIDQVVNKMALKHRVSDYKGQLAADIAIREKKIIDSFDNKDGYSLYIGIPFCPSTCLYCSFTSYPIVSYKDKVRSYLDAIYEELKAAKEIMVGKHLDTIYIGGGTPSSLSSQDMDYLLSKVQEVFGNENIAEYTVEAGRADSITEDKLKVLKKYGVSRISVNPQTMNDDTLKRIGRHHDTKAVIDAFNMAREVGFDNINMDIILGLPGEDLAYVDRTLEAIKELKPDSLTVHSLAIKRASRLKEMMDKYNSEIGVIDFDKAMNMSIEAADSMGLKPYYLYRQKDMGGNLENTGFASDGKYGIYNILMMEEVQSIYAIGAGTVTKRVYDDGHIERCDTHKDVNLYIADIEAMIERKRGLIAKKERNRSYE